MNGDPIRILLVEDNDDHAELVVRSLGEHRVNNEITHVTDGAQALDYLFRRGDHEGREGRDPDLVLLDLRLPKVDGLGVLKEIRASDIGHIPVVILTTSEGEKDLVEAYNLRANAYVVKPVDFAKFVELMRDLGLFWLTWNRHPFKPNPDDRI